MKWILPIKRCTHPELPEGLFNNLDEAIVDLKKTVKGLQTYRNNI